MKNGKQRLRGPAPAQQSTPDRPSAAAALRPAPLTMTCVALGFGPDVVGLGV